MQRRRTLSCIAMLAVLGVLTALVASRQPFILEADNAVGRALVVRGAGTSIDVLQVLTAPGAEDVRYPILMPIAGFLLWFRRWRLAAFVAVSALAVAPPTTLLKEAVGRERPSYAGTSVEAGGMSFPSGHSSGAAVLTGVLLVLLWPRTPRRWRPALAAAAALGAALIGWTRLALGVHYLSDVLGGLALGTAVVLLAALILGTLGCAVSEPGREPHSRQPGVMAQRQPGENRIEIHEVQHDQRDVQADGPEPELSS